MGQTLVVQQGPLSLVRRPRYIHHSSFTLHGSFGPYQFVSVIVFVLIQCALLVNSFVLDEGKVLSSDPVNLVRLGTSSSSSNLNQSATSLVSDIQGTTGELSSLHQQHELNKNNNESDCSEHRKVEQILADIFHDHEDEAIESDEGEEEGASFLGAVDTLEEKLSDDDDENEEAEAEHQQQLQPEAFNSFELDEEPIKEDVESNSPATHSISRRSVSQGQDTPASAVGEPRHHLHHHHHTSRKRYPQKHPRTPSNSRRSRRPPKKKSVTRNVDKYNEYMDIVLKRMNSMIKTKKMDPLMVNLFSGSSSSSSSSSAGAKDKDVPKKKKKKSTTRKKRKGAKNRGRSEVLDEEEEDDQEVEEVDDDVVADEVVMMRSEDEDDDSDEVELDNDHDRDGGRVKGISRSKNFRAIRALIINGSMQRSASSSSNTSTEDSSSSSTTTTPPTTTSSPKSPTTTPKTETRGFDKQTEQSTEESRKHSNSKKNKNKQQEKEKPKKNNKNKNKKKKQQQKPTRGVLKGLSSLRRNGNVDVIRQGDKVRIVRSNFLLGPVTLEIVPKGGKQDSNKKKKPTVTAIAHQLKGIIEVRLKKNSPTTIKRLRVFPPSSVKIKSSSNKKSRPSSSSSSSSSSSGSSVPRYSKVTPVATQRLRQIATAVVRQADVRRRTGGLDAKQ